MSVECIRCGFADHEEQAEYCINCGLELDGNYCTNDHCVLNNGESISCPTNACFCPQCGSETVFFKDGIIKPFEKKQS